jgi:hypothetical protein
MCTGGVVQAAFEEFVCLNHIPGAQDQVHFKVSLRRAVDAVQRVERVACVRTDHQGFGEAATTGKQPANLAVEAAEESLSILPDHAPTVRPPPKRC